MSILDIKAFIQIFASIKVSIVLCLCFCLLMDSKFGILRKILSDV